MRPVVLLFSRRELLTYDVSGRLVANMRVREKVLAGLAICGSIIGGIGLVLLAVFDTKDHRILHRNFLLCFIGGVGMSAIFTVIEVRESCDMIPERNLILQFSIGGSAKNSRR